MLRPLTFLTFVVIVLTCLTAWVQSVQVQCYKVSVGPTDRSYYWDGWSIH